MDAANLPQLLKQAQDTQNAEEYEQAIQLYSALLAQIDADVTDPDLKEMRLVALREQGELYHRVGDQGASLENFQAYYLEAGTNRRTVEALFKIGRQHSQMGQHHKALGAHREALQLAKVLNDTSGRAAAYSGIAGALIGLGRYEETLPNLEKALALFIQLVDYPQQSRVYNMFGIGYLYMGRIDKSIAAFQKTLQLSDYLGTWEKAIILSNLGESYQFLFDMEQALIHHQKALDLATSVQSRPIMAEIRRNLGVDLLYLGKLDEALAHFYAALTISEETGVPHIKMQTLYQLALAEIEREDDEKAYQHASALQTLAEAESATGFLANALHALGLCHHHRGETAAATQVWQQAILMAHSAGQQMLIWQLHAALAQIALTPDLAKIHYRMAAEMIEQVVYPIEDVQLRQRFLQARPVQAVLSQV